MYLWLCLSVGSYDGCSYFFSVHIFVFIKEKTAYEMRISVWSSDVRSSDLSARPRQERASHAAGSHHRGRGALRRSVRHAAGDEHGPRRLDDDGSLQHLARCPFAGVAYYRHSRYRPPASFCPLPLLLAPHLSPPILTSGFLLPPSLFLPPFSLL